MSAELGFSSLFNESSALTRPLCVDLDGTLVSSDTLSEEMLLLLRQRPWLALLTPLWLLGGRARFKRSLASRVRLSPESLPYRRQLLDALRESRAHGRKLVLATAADRTVADAVARHLELFDDIHASDGEKNLKATHKRDALVASYGERGFDYIGDSSADEAIFRAAERGYLVGASSRATRLAHELSNVKLISRRPNVLVALLRELRLHQWAKNALLVLPVLLSPSGPTVPVLALGVLSALTFSLCASAGYVVNDLLDIEADRAHQSKLKRPFASGALQVILGPPLFFALVFASFGLSFTFLPLGFSAMLLLYFVGTLSYSFYLKRLLLLDVLVLAGLYTHRILSGGIATGVKVSAWLLGFSMFFFTSLAFAKRYVELRALTGDDKVKNRGYYRTDVAVVTSMGTASGYIAALVFVLYVDGPTVRAVYREPLLLWLILPVLLYWLGRLWLLAGRGRMQEDPVKFALKDPVSLLCGAIIASIAGSARFAPEWLSGALH
jgi:4-hydroxybenzoate polyprenyltransferase/phosphoserine phosphatase